MKKALTVILTAILLLSLPSCGKNKEQTPPPAETVSGDHTINAMEGKYKTQGRTILYDQGLAMLSSADSFEFNAECSGKASVVIRAEGEDTDVFFTGYVDGERCDERFHIDKEGAHEIVLSDGLASGLHNFRIVRQTEWDHGDIYVTGVKVDGTIAEKPADKDIYIEFIGDSLTTGYGNLSDIPDSEGEWGGAPIFQDATQAFPYLTSEALGADMSVVAIQGIGCACGYLEEFTMNDVYKIYPRINEKDYEFKPTRQPDYVVIDLLSNDSDTRKKNRIGTDEVVEKAVELINIVRETYPDAVIIFIPAAFENRIEQEIAALGGAENGYYCTSIPLDMLGKGGHPSLEGHKAGAAALIEFIRGIAD